MIEIADFLAQGRSEVGLSDVIRDSEGNVGKECRVDVCAYKSSYSDVDKVQSTMMLAKYNRIEPGVPEYLRVLADIRHETIGVGRNAHRVTHDIHKLAYDKIHH